MATMRAVVMHRKGTAAEALELHTDWPRPARKPNQMLVEAAATSFNSGEWKVRSGFAPIPVKMPKILGEDLAGVVVEAPEGSKFKVGDRVFAGTGQFMKSGDQGGTDAEFVAADEDTVCLMPAGMSFQEAAAIPVAGLTAWQALQRAGVALEGKRVLVHGGAGGVGGFAVQIAKAQGAYVTTTCSTRNLDYVTRELGADVAVDYTQGPWEQQPAVAGGEGFDLVVDTIGGSYEVASLKLLKPGGMLCALGSTGPDVARVSLLGMAALLFNAFRRTLMGRLGLAPKYAFIMQESKASKGLEQMAGLYAQGKLKVHIDRVFPLEQLVQAHEYAERGHVRGKVGILIKAL